MYFFLEHPRDIVISVNDCYEKYAILYVLWAGHAQSTCSLKGHEGGIIFVNGGTGSALRNVDTLTHSRPNGHSSKLHQNITKMEILTPLPRTFSSLRG